MHNTASLKVPLPRKGAQDNQYFGQRSATPVVPSKKKASLKKSKLLENYTQACHCSDGETCKQHAILVSILLNSFPKAFPPESPQIGTILTPVSMNASAPGASRCLGEPLTQTFLRCFCFLPNTSVTLFIHLGKFAAINSLFVSTLLRMFQLHDKTIIPALLPKLNAQPASIQSSNTWGGARVRREVARPEPL